MAKYNIELHDGSKWTQYNVEPGDKFWAIRTHGNLSKAGCWVRVRDTEGNQIDTDELNGKNADMRLTEEYQLGWQECWDWLKSTGAAW